jgi:hypothetical protein
MGTGVVPEGVLQGHVGFMRAEIDASLENLRPPTANSDLNASHERNPHSLLKNHPSAYGLAPEGVTLKPHLPAPPSPHPMLP